MTTDHFVKFVHPLDGTGVYNQFFEYMRDKANSFGCSSYREQEEENEALISVTFYFQNEAKKEHFKDALLSSDKQYLEE
ncbi:hypothetical protein [Pedobacter sp. SYSU D00535]|uniref:hypothetical protein n=1 Tax=Pedobacter sp. SYSU D00535 TaxID=2810308 RepID=UPI001A9688A8|nr:hypothetical protein [Pedobacter sp. SYSU D00535]